MIVQCDARDTAHKIVVNFPEGRLHVLQSLEASQRCCLPGFKLHANLNDRTTLDTYVFANALTLYYGP